MQRSPSEIHAYIWVKHTGNLSRLPMGFVDSLQKRLKLFTVLMTLPYPPPEKKNHMVVSSDFTSLSNQINIANHLIYTISHTIILFFPDLILSYFSESVQTSLFCPYDVTVLCYAPCSRSQFLLILNTYYMKFEQKVRTPPLIHGYPSFTIHYIASKFTFSGFVALSFWSGLSIRWYDLFTITVRTPFNGLRCLVSKAHVVAKS